MNPTIQPLARRRPLGVDESAQRLVWLDALRGLIIVIMALDHASNFIARVHPGEFWGVPLPVYSDAGHFLTRFVTHFCAPGFFFLMGVSMVLFTDSRRLLGWPEARITRFFALRGSILILLQLLIENPAWALGIVSGTIHGTPPPGGTGEMVLLYFGVLSALGAAMLVWSFLLRFNSAMIVTLSVVTILITQLLIPDPENAAVPYSPVLRLLLIPGQTGMWQVFYPVLPWLGVAGLGIAWGRMIRHDRNRAYRGALVGGISAIICFTLLRLFGEFGEFHAMTSGWVGFLNVTKYPPSLDFILLTLGVDLLLLILLARIEAQVQRWAKFLIVFGGSALFFYIVHLYLYACVGVAFPNGTTFGVMYAVWILGLVPLYPLCRWYQRFKSRRPPESVWRFF